MSRRVLNTPRQEFLAREFLTARYCKTRTLTNQFGESGLNRQTLTFQSKATKQNKHTKISTFTRISSKFLSTKFFESDFVKV